MTRLAVSGIPYFRVEPYEAERDAVSCTWQTLEYFRGKYPDDHMFFIIGADSLFTIERWIHPNGFSRFAPFCLPTGRGKFQGAYGGADPQAQG